MQLSRNTFVSIFALSESIFKLQLHEMCALNNPLFKRRHIFWNYSETFAIGYSKNKYNNFIVLMPSCNSLSSELLFCS